MNAQFPTVDAYRYDRRALLRGLGLGLGMLPLLPLSRAQAGAPAPRRLFTVTWTNGVIADAFFPKFENTQSENGSTTTDTNDLASVTLPAITAPLDPWKSRLLFMSNLELRNFTDHPGHGGAHENYCVVFTGRPGIPKDSGDPRYIPVVASGITIDQHIANGLSRKHRFVRPALHLGTQVDKMGGGEMQARNSFKDYGQPNGPEDDPHVVFAELFAGTARNDKKSREKNQRLDRMKAERRSLLDHVGRELIAFGQRLGGEDRVKVEAHLQSVRDIELQLSAPPHKPSRACQSPNVPPKLDPRDNNSYPQLCDVQLRLATAALACDITRVVTLQLSNGNGSGLVFSWLGIEGKGSEFPIRDHHDVAHRPGPDNRDKIAIDRWYMERMAHAMKYLAAVREGNKTLLDNTALLWTNHMGNGGGHTSDKLPWILAGGCGGYFKTGQHIKLPPRTATNGLFAGLANAMGVPTPSFGDPKYGGELTQLRARS